MYQVWSDRPTGSTELGEEQASAGRSTERKRFTPGLKEHLRQNNIAVRTQ